MIFDTLKHCAQYYALHPEFEKAFSFLNQAVQQGISAGRYELSGDALYAVVQEYATREEGEGEFEGHRNYIDIQYIVSGEELVYTQDIIKAVSSGDYSEEYDAQFFTSSENSCRLVLQADDFAIFFPHDLHRPCLAVSKTVPVKKIVVKVKIS